MKLVKIDWIDAQSWEIGLIPINEIGKGYFKPVIASTVGFLVYEDKEICVVAGEYWHETKQTKYFHIIPKQLIRRVKNLK